MPYRQNCRPAALLALWLTCVASSPADAGDALVDRTWQLDRNSAAWATLTSNPDGLTVDLKAAGKGPLHIICDKPLPLPDGVKRLTLWADPAGLGNAFPWKVLTASAHARVCDARGAVYRFPFCMGSLNNRGWGCLATEDLARCPYRQPWEKSPQKPLALIGLEIQPGPNALQQIRLHGLAADSDAHTLPVRPWEIVGLTDPEDRESWNTWTGSGVQYDAEDWHNGLLHETDYSPSVGASYQHYLQDVRGDALSAVSARYGRSLASWQELMPPQKSWESELDLRPEWVDFCDYQQWQLYQWLECVFRTIRQADPVHDMTQYQFCAYGPQEYYYPLFQKYHVEPTTGGTEGPNYQRFMSVYHLWGLRSRGGETIQTVNRWNFYRSVFNMLAYGGPGGYYAVQWHNVFPEPWDSQPDGPLNFQRWAASRSVGGWLKRVRDINFAPDFARGSRLLAELGHTQPMPAEAGALSSYANCLYKMRCLLPYFVSGSAVNGAWMEREHRLPLWVTESTPPDLYRHLKLLVADADIPAMSRTTAANLASYVKSGGCLIAFVATGRYTVESGRADFGFLSALGFAPPTPRPKNRAGMAAQGSGLLAGENLVFNDLWTLQPPPQTEILANLPDGTPCVFRRRLGAGEIILFLGQLDWERSGHVLGALCHHRDVPQWCDATDTRVQVYALHEDDTRYVLAYDPLDHRQNESPGGPSVDVRVKIRQLTAPAYSVTELVGGQSLGVFTRAQLEAGLPLQFQPGQLKVLQCLPANPAGS
jgi:hypothetical protein